MSSQASASVPTTRTGRSSYGRDSHARRQLAPTLDLRKPLDASGTVPQRVAARTFCEWGLVNEVVPDDRLTAAVMDLAGRIEGKSQAALARMKAAVEFSLDHSIAEALRHEA